MTGTKEDATELLHRLVGVPLLTPTRRSPNTVLDVSPPNVLVATDKKPAGESVPIEQVQRGLDLLLEVGEVEVNPDTLGHRSSFIGAILLQLPGAVVVPAPPRIRLIDPDAYRLQQVRVPQVVIQPSYGGAGRDNWRITLDQPVPFTEPQFAAALTRLQLAELRRMHPDGLARFWGATRAQDANLERMSSGDVALFMGDNAVRGIGEIGVVFRNPSLADALWTPDPRNGSWQNVYSLRTFELAEIPRADIVSLPGFNPNDVFMSQRVLDAERSATVLELLGIQTQASADLENRQREGLISRLARLTGQVVPAESVLTTQTSYDQFARTVLVHRAESLLIKAYRDSLVDDQATTLRVKTGLADYYAVGADGAEILEAKSSADHNHVRQALAQLLDYRRFSPQPVAHLSALFPQRPGQLGIDLLHDYGIDCVYLDDRDGFVRVPAPLADRPI